MLRTESNEARICPGMEGPCTKDKCVMFIGEGVGCRLALIPSGYRPMETKGKRCPFYKERETDCGEFCELFKDGGCAMTATEAKITRVRKSR